MVWVPPKGAKRGCLQIEVIIKVLLISHKLILWERLHLKRGMANPIGEVGLTDAAAESDGPAKTEDST